MMSKLAAFENGCFVMDDGERIRLPRNAYCDGMRPFKDEPGSGLCVKITAAAINDRPLYVLWQGIKRDWVIRCVDSFIKSLSLHRQLQTSDWVMKN